MTLRGFGFTYENGIGRHWYIGADGIKRWVVGDQPVDQCITPNPVGATQSREVLDERKA
jgi:hypothetical protein